MKIIALNKYVILEPLEEDGAEKKSDKLTIFQGDLVTSESRENVGVFWARYGEERKKVFVHRNMVLSHTYQGQTTYFCPESALILEVVDE